MNAKILFSVALIAGMGDVNTARAQSPEDRVLAPFEKCSSLADSGERLRCYDAAAANARQLATRLKDEANRRTVDDFGLSATQIIEKKKKIAAENPKRAAEYADARERSNPSQITDILSAYFVDRFGKALFILENGQIWKEGSNRSFSGRYQKGAKLTIRRGRISGYRLKFDGKSGFIGVKRVR